MFFRYNAVFARLYGPSGGMAGVYKRVQNMVLRLIIFILLVYIFTRVFKKIFTSLGPSARRPSGGAVFGNTLKTRPDEMVQDPVCKVYIPKGEALRIVREGTTYYFCSRECLEKFRAERS